MSQSAARTARDPGGSERIFAAEDGRLWGAARLQQERGATEAIVFSCISDSRQTVRAIEVGRDHDLADVSDETLRAWLRAAPRIGRLT